MHDSWGAIFHYAGIYCIHFIWEEGVDKIINLPFLLPKCFCHSNIPSSKLVFVSDFHPQNSQNSLVFAFGFEVRGPGHGESFPWGLKGVSCVNRFCGCWSCCAGAEHWVPSDRGTCMLLISWFVHLLYARLCKAQSPPEWHLLWASGQYWNI